MMCIFAEVLYVVVLVLHLFWWIFSILSSKWFLFILISWCFRWWRYLNFWDGVVDVAVRLWCGCDGCVVVVVVVYVFLWGFRWEFVVVVVIADDVKGYLCGDWYFLSFCLSMFVTIYLLLFCLIIDAVSWFFVSIVWSSLYVLSLIVSCIGFPLICLSWLLAIHLLLQPVGCIFTYARSCLEGYLSGSLTLEVVSWMITVVFRVAKWGFMSFLWNIRF